MKKNLALLLAATMVAGCFMTGCGSATKETKAADSSSDAKEILSVCLASEPDTLDPALNSAVDGATMVIHLFQGLASWQVTEDGGYTIVPAAATEVIPAAAPGPDAGGKVATEVIPAE